MKRICNESRLQDSENGDVVIPAGSVILDPEEFEAFQQAGTVCIALSKIGSNSKTNTNFENTSSSKANPVRVKA